MTSLRNDIFKDVTSSSKNNDTEIEINIILNNDAIKKTSFSIHANMIKNGTVATDLLPSASTSQSGIVKLYDNADSTSKTLAVTANALKNVKDNMTTDVYTDSEGIGMTNQPSLPIGTTVLLYDPYFSIKDSRDIFSVIDHIDDNGSYLSSSDQGRGLPGTWYIRGITPTIWGEYNEDSDVFLPKSILAQRGS